MTARKKKKNEVPETEAPEVQAGGPPDAAERAQDVAGPAQDVAKPAQDVAKPAQGFGRAAQQDETADDSASQAAESLGGFRYEGGYPIVGVGASAGGLEALEAFFDHVPPDCGMAFVVVQHLSPDFKSLMDELLARHTAMAIHRVEEGMPVEPNSVYLIPPKKEMIIEGGRLRLTDKPPGHGLSLPIDIFFHSLAKDAGPRAVGIVLSGSGSDGSRGVVSIHEAGGLVIAQDPDSARFDSMPGNAIETGAVDVVCSPDRMPAVLQKFADDLQCRDFSDVLQVEASDSAFGPMFELLRNEYGVDFSHYRPNTILRRVERRLMMTQSSSIDEYSQRLAHDPAELNALYRDLLIGVTRFLRDPDAFEHLRSDIIPGLLERAQETGELRVWVAGCATGEEAYSIAMLLHAEAAARDLPLSARVFATDLHHGSLEIASTGAYGFDAVRDVPPELLQRYFVRQGDTYLVGPELRQMVVFAPHNLLRDAPFTKLDLISCRNLLIYLQPAAQQKVLSLFHFGLRQGGVLFLGSSESPGELADEFDVIDSHHKIYRKRRDTILTSGYGWPVVPMKQSWPTDGSRKVPKPFSGIRDTSPSVADTRLVRLYDALLDRKLPPSLVVNSRREVQHMIGDIGRLLTPRSGRPSRDVLDLFDPKLRVVISGLLQRAGKDGQRQVFNHVIRENGKAAESGDETGTASTDAASTTQRGLRIVVEPIDIAGTSESFFLIELHELDHVPSVESAADVAAVQAGELSAEQLGSMEAELRYTKESLQATIEELETSNEELQATNEELVASNEQLQSTNEELHSVNEELYTVNAEHQRKIQELTALTEDMDNLLRSTDIGTIFLDRELCIRKFTPAIAAAFELTPSDVGRRIDVFAHSIEYDGLLDDVRQVLNEGGSISRQVRNRDGQWFVMRVLPYESRVRQASGVVITFTEITPLKRADEENARKARALEQINAELRRTIAEREQAERELSESLRRRDEFIALLSHELHNPLGAIENSIEIARRPDVSPEQREQALDVVERQCRQVSTLLEELLDATRVETGTLELNRREVDFAHIVRESASAIAPLMSNRGHSFDVDVGDELLPVSGDPVRLQQALINLLDNAARYTPGGGQVKLEVERVGSDCLCRVIDNGPGIDEEKTQELFGLFNRSEHGRRQSERGMGIGLTMVDRLVKLHGGRVEAKNVPDGGAQFEIRLPLVVEAGAAERVSEDPLGDNAERAAAHGSEPARLPDRDREPSRSHVNGTGYRVLLVEDDADSREMLRLLLDLDGFEVFVAQSGEEALATVEELSPQIVLIDIGLPGIDGYEVARQIRETLGEAPFLIALTGYGQARDRRLSKQAGFNEHLTKPARAEKLEQLMKKALEKVEG